MRNRGGLHFGAAPSLSSTPCFVGLMSDASVPKNFSEHLREQNGSPRYSKSGTLRWGVNGRGPLQTRQVPSRRTVGSVIGHREQRLLRQPPCRQLAVLLVQLDEDGLAS